MPDAVKLTVVPEAVVPEVLIAVGAPGAAHGLLPEPVAEYVSVQPGLVPEIVITDDSVTVAVGEYCT